jgi:predicted GNAT family acetyltransferase
VEHNLLLGLAATLVEDPGRYGASPAYFVTVHDGDDVVAAVLRTPPHPVVLSGAPDGALAAILADLPGALSGVLAPSDTARAFAARWCALTGVRVEGVTAERIYALEAVVPPSDVPGEMRLGEERDRSLLVAWWDAFTLEALGRADRAASERAVTARLRGGDSGVTVWLSAGGEPVAVAGWSGPTPNGIRVGPVYTPPEHRRRGYASALTAALSARLLAGGRRFCFLFTNLANPTSNRIYQAIGYRPVSDMERILFGAR